MQKTLRKRLFLAGVPVLALFLSAQTAQATPLTPGGDVVPDAIAFTGGEAVLAYTSQAFAGATFSGTLNAAVLDEGAANPLGGLTFIYQVTNDVTSATDLGRETNFVFSALNTGGLVHVHNADGSLLAGFIAGTEASLSGDWDGMVIGFDFTLAGGTIPPEKIQPGETSLVLVIRTSAPSYIVGGSSIINGGSDTVPTFQPAPLAVPEPASMLLFGTALAGFAAVVRRRKTRT